MVNLRIVILPYGKIAIANLPYGNFTIRKFTVIGLDIETTSKAEHYNSHEPRTIDGRLDSSLRRHIGN